MLSIERCKEILSNKTISDSQVEKLREALYALVDNVIDQHISSYDRIKTL